MSPRSDKQKITEREEVELLLPWYVNGTLSVEDIERVERHLAQNAEMREQLAILRTEKEAVIDAIKELEAPPVGALEKIVGAIEEEKATAAEKNKPYLLGLLKKRISGLFHPPVLQIAAAAAVVLILVQWGIIFGLLLRDSPEAPQDHKNIASERRPGGRESRIPGRVQVGDPSVLPKDFAKGLRGSRIDIVTGYGFNIGYAPSAKIGEIYHHLSKLGGVIINGPRISDPASTKKNGEIILLEVVFPKEKISLENLLQELRAAQGEGLVKSFRMRQD